MIFSMTKSITQFKEKRHWLDEPFNEKEVVIKEEIEVVYGADIKALQDSFFDNIPEGFKQYWIDINSDYEDKDIEFVDYAEYHNGYEYDTEICVWFNKIEVNNTLYTALEELQSKDTNDNLCNEKQKDINKTGTFYEDGEKYIVDTEEGQQVGKLVYSRKAEYETPWLLKNEEDKK